MGEAEMGHDRLRKLHADVSSRLHWYSQTGGARREPEGLEGHSVLYSDCRHARVKPPHCLPSADSAMYCVVRAHVTFSTPVHGCA
jgi:hypothetical protein